MGGEFPDIGDFNEDTAAHSELDNSAEDDMSAATSFEDSLNTAKKRASATFAEELKGNISELNGKATIALTSIVSSVGEAGGMEDLDSPANQKLIRESLLKFKNNSEDILDKTITNNPSTVAAGDFKSQLNIVDFMDTVLDNLPSTEPSPPTSSDELVAKVVKMGQDKYHTGMMDLITDIDPDFASKYNDEITTLSENMREYCEECMKGSASMGFNVEAATGMLSESFSFGNGGIELQCTAAQRKELKKPLLSTINRLEALEPPPATVAAVTNKVEAVTGQKTTWTEILKKSLSYALGAMLVAGFSVLSMYLKIRMAEAAAAAILDSITGCYQMMGTAGKQLPEVWWKDGVKAGNPTNVALCECSSKSRITNAKCPGTANGIIGCLKAKGSGICSGSFGPTSCLPLDSNCDPATPNYPPCIGYHSCPPPSSTPNPKNMVIYTWRTATLLSVMNGFWQGAGALIKGAGGMLKTILKYAIIMIAVFLIFYIAYKALNTSGKKTSYLIMGISIIAVAIAGEVTLAVVKF